MSAIDDIRRMRPVELMVAIGAFISIASPGLILIYIYKLPLLISLDSFKILLLSISITIPVFLVNITFAPLLSDKNKPKNIGEMTINAMIGSSMSQYTAILVAYLFALTFKWYLATLALAQAAIFIFDILFIVKKQKSAA